MDVPWLFGAVLGGSHIYSWLALRQAVVTCVTAMTRPATLIGSIAMRYLRDKSASGAAHRARDCDRYTIRCLVFSFSRITHTHGAHMKYQVVGPSPTPG